MVDPQAALPYEIDKETGAIPLAEFVREGIRLLDGPQGFFLMIESGKIDWACHANDPMATVAETLAFDGCLALVLEFLKKHPRETLVVVTADHECGGMSFGRTFTGYDFHCEPIARQPVSYDKLMALAERIRRDGLSHYQTSMQLREYMGFGVLNPWENEVMRRGLEMTKVAPDDRYWDLHATQDFGKKEPLAQACLRIVFGSCGSCLGLVHTTMAPSSRPARWAWRPSASAGSTTIPTSAGTSAKPWGWRRSSATTDSGSSRPRGSTPSGSCREPRTGWASWWLQGSAVPA